MRLFPSLFLLGILAGVSRAVSVPAALYTFNSQSRIPQNPESVLSPEALRLILAHHLKISEFHSLKGATQSTIDRLNDVLGSQRPFQETGSRGIPKVVLIIEGVEDTDLSTSLQTKIPKLGIENPPCSSANSQLVRDFKAQLDSKISWSPAFAVDFSYPGTIDGSIYGVSQHQSTSNKCSQNSLDAIFTHYENTDARINDLSKVLSLLGNGLTKYCGANPTTAIFHIRTLEAIANNEGTSNKFYKDARDILLGNIKNFMRLGSSGEQETTILLMPLETRNDRSSVNPYGKFTVPTGIKSQAPFEKRGLGLALQSQTSKNYLNISQPRRVCYSTLESCRAETNDCSGHGTCQGKRAASAACFSCKCGNTTSNSKTTYWGGAACQKVDVSAPFFLLAGFSIILIGIVTWSIGLLYSIGQEALPGVIGAGVSGPRAK